MGPVDAHHTFQKISLLHHSSEFEEAEQGEARRSASAL